MLSLVAALAAGACATGMTWLVLPKLSSDQHWYGILSRILIGTALLSCLLVLLLSVLPGKYAAWIALLVSAGCSLVAMYRGLICFDSLKINLLILLSVAYVAWRLVGCLVVGSVVPLEGTGSHDEFWFIFSAAWLHENSLSDPFSANDFFPFDSSAGVQIGLLPRIGAELLLVMASILSGNGPVESFVTVFAAGSLLLLYSAFLPLSSLLELQHTANRVPVLLLIAMSPVFLFIYGNMNFATVFGMAFLGGFIHYFYDGLRSSVDKVTNVAAGIFLGAVLATYPEMLAIALPAGVIILFQVYFESNQFKIQYIIRSLGIMIFTTIVVAPTSIVGAFSVLFHAKQMAFSNGPEFSELVSRVTWWNFPLWFSLIDVDFVNRVGGNVGVAFVSFVLFVSILAAPIRLWRRCLGLMCACAVLYFSFRARGYGYGAMKSLEFLSLPLAPLFATGALRLSGLIWNNVYYLRFNSSLRVAAAIVGVVAILTWSLVAVERSVSYLALAYSKHLSTSFRGLEQVVSKLEGDPVVFVSGDLGAHPFMASRWAAYLLRSVPLIFEKVLHEGGYIYNLGRVYEESYRKITHVLRVSSPIDSAIDFDGQILSSGEFELYPVNKGAAIILDGFGAAEGNFRWMSQEGVLAVFGDSPKRMTIEIVGCFTESPEQGAIDVFVDRMAESQVFLPTGKGIINVSLPGGGPHIVTLRSAVPARSPKSMGLSEDSRMLTYSVGRISVQASGG